MMSVFKILGGLIEEIHAIFARLWWGDKESEKNILWHRLETLCLPKAMGGMGFHDLKCFTQALLANQGFRLQEDNESLLCKVSKARYYKHTELWMLGEGMTQATHGEAYGGKVLAP